jgi:hypothetical protein
MQIKYGISDSHLKLTRTVTLTGIHYSQSGSSNAKHFASFVFVAEHHIQ